MSPVQRLRRLVPLITICCLGLLACGEDADPDAGDGAATTPPVADTPTAMGQSPSPTPDTDGTATPTPTSTPTSTPTGEDTAASAGDEAVQVVGVDYAYEGVPASLDAGTELTFRNDSDLEVHELVLVRLPDTEERSVEDILQMTPQEQEELISESVVGVSVARPGEDGMVVDGELAVAEPGRYIMVCFVPTGADPDEFMDAAATGEGPPQVEGGLPHVANGMWAELSVQQ